ncbi:T9SS type A sorting domain-containing protein [Lacinutrix neustonica]|uniref:T9SS type A sorting domain-containing protein n=1 Tax=Lacinutrix neustonica TaxID=2980107 RepID=A0A9E8SDM4_9FLAO|nr:T9SS type A sorting domain-containing protein [Lacinutrix neustonica]WAC01354.1 T9SS type A sorting domain-containing protein [Lacinutrix neustonica]
MEHFKVIGGGHTWPGTSYGSANQDINASEEIWNFFSRYDINGEITTLSMESFGLSKITIHPNPAASEIAISHENYSKHLDYKIVSLQGKLLNQGMISSTNQKIDISYLSEGLYFLIVENTTYKILKTN